ncbi:MAG: PAS domain S-box protein [Chloroflexi bacterium]|nr:PAS domain S-box protein [Chloroflexota bacterium]
MVRRWLDNPLAKRSAAALFGILDAPVSVVDDRRRARIQLLNAMLLFFALAIYLGLVADRFFMPFVPVVFGVASLLLLSIGAIRAGFYTPISALFGVLVATTPPLLWFSSPSAYEILIVWSITAAIIGYLLFTLRGMMALMVASEITGATVIFLVESTRYAVPDYLFFSSVLYALLIFAATLRDRSTGIIDEQAVSLKQERMRINALLEAAQEGIIIHGKGIILMVNPAVQRLLGYSSEELIGKDIRELVTPEYRDILTSRYRAEDDRPYEVLMHCKDGRSLTVEFTGRSQYYNGERVRIVTLRDMTPRLLEQQRQIELTVEQEKVRILQHFINDISHDLRTPLSIINTSIYLIRRLGAEPERQRTQIEVLEQQAAHVHRLLEDLITMSRLDKAEASDFLFRRVDLHDLLQQVIGDTLNEALRKNQKLIFSPCSGSAIMMADATEIKRMMRHLIMNGLTYTPEGGLISITTRLSPEAVTIVVKDNGPGIAKDVLPFIFDEFYRGDPARGGDGGIGLGLTIARKIARAHQGAIEVTSAQGQGSEFHVKLPLSIQS